MTAPAQSLRVVFALSMFACSVILVLFVRGRAEWTNDFWLHLVAVASIVSTAICYVAFRKGNMRLVGVSLAQLARVFLPQLVFMYISSAIAITVVALAVIYAVTRSGPNAVALAVLAGLWLSLWLAPSIACLTSWHKLRAAQRDDA